MSNQRTVTGLGSGTNLCLSELARKSWNFDDVFCGLGEGLQNCISVHVRIPQHKGVHTSPRMVLVLNPVAMLSAGRTSWFRDLRYEFLLFSDNVVFVLIRLS